MSFVEEISKFRLFEYNAILEFQTKQTEILDEFHTYQNNILDNSQNIMYMYYLDAVLDKDDKTQQIYLLKVKLKKAETQIISEFQKEQKLALIKIQNAEIQAYNTIYQAIIMALNMINHDDKFNIFNIWNQALNMPNVCAAKNQAKTNVSNTWDQVQKNIYDAIAKHLPNYINKVNKINKSIKNLLRFQIKNKNISNGFNLVEIQNYEILINDNNNIALRKIKNAMDIFLIKNQNAKNQSTYNINTAIEQTMKDIQYKWEQYGVFKELKN